MRLHAKHILFPLATIALFVTIGAIAVIGLRQAGRFRTLEFNLYDHWVKQRQKESPPRRSPCVLVTITEDDIRAWNHYPITDRMMSDLLEKILQGGPAAVGLDIFRDVPASNETSSLADQERFIKLFQDHPNLVAPIAIYDRPEDSVGVLPRIAQLEGQTAFTNLLQDEDDVVRRSVLQMPDHAGVMQFSLASRLAQMYVGDRFDVSTDEADPWQKFGNVYYRPIHRDGGYVGKVRAQRDLVQMFIDFRAGIRAVLRSGCCYGPCESAGVP